jgi:hypothetical protein
VSGRLKTWLTGCDFVEPNHVDSRIVSFFSFFESKGADRANDPV